MSKKIKWITLLATLFPGTALAHFQEEHAPFWQIPMHYLTQHYQGLVVGAVILAVAAVLLKRASDKD